MGRFVLVSLRSSMGTRLYDHSKSSVRTSVPWTLAPSCIQYGMCGKCSTLRMRSWSSLPYAPCSIASASSGSVLCAVIAVHVKTSAAVAGCLPVRGIGL